MPKGVRLALKSLRPKNYSDQSQTLGEHLKKRRKELGLLQRKVAAGIGINHFTYITREKDKTKPVASQFQPFIEFLGFDPTPAQDAARAARGQAPGMTFDQAAQQLGWELGTLTRYLNGTWRMPVHRSAELKEFLAANNTAIAAAVLAQKQER